jgi:hypothetical protein
MMRRSFILLFAAGILATAVPSASAKTTCSVPDEPAWHSCLTARHVTLASGAVQLTRATPTLVMRLADGCPDHLAKRKVVVRTNHGNKIISGKVAGRCRKGVARFRVNLRPDVAVPAGTVIRSFWSGIRDDKVAPKVKLGG